MQRSNWSTLPLGHYDSRWEIPWAFCICPRGNHQAILLQIPLGATHEARLGWLDELLAWCLHNHRRETQGTLGLMDKTNPPNMDVVLQSRGRWAISRQWRHDQTLQMSNQVTKHKINDDLPINMGRNIPANISRWSSHLCCTTLDEQS